MIEPQGNKLEKILNSEIGLAVGVAVHEFDEMKEGEVQEFRRNILDVCKRCTELRDLNGLEGQALYAYPPEVESKSDLPASIEKKLDKGEIILCIWQMAGSEQQKFTFRVSKDVFPETVIVDAVSKRSKNLRLTREQQLQLIDEHQKNYVLKVCGMEEYLLERYPICQYKVNKTNSFTFKKIFGFFLKKADDLSAEMFEFCIRLFENVINLLLQYIRQCLSKGEIPQLCLYSRRDVYASLPESEMHMPSYMRRTPIPIPTPTGASLISLWQLNTLFRVHILWATYVNVRDVDMIYVRAGIYHGQEVMTYIF